MATRTAYRTCPLCEATCDLELTVEDERVTKVLGDRDDVFSHGFLCPKGVSLQDLHEGPDRLRSPLVRRGGALVEARWDEAVANSWRHDLPLLAGVPSAAPSRSVRTTPSGSGTGSR